jgi:O-antigen/teichoic acid export membrane protein
VNAALQPDPESARPASTSTITAHSLVTGAPALRRVLLNGSALLAAYVLPRALTFGAALVAARLLGPAQFGAYGTAVSFTMILSILATLGMQPLLVRELARAPHRAGIILSSAHRIKLAAASIMIGSTYLVARGLDYPPEVVQAALMLAIAHGCASFAENLGAWFQAEERMHVWMEASMWFGLVSGLLGIALVVWTRSVPHFAAGYALGQVAALLWLLHRLPAAARAWEAPDWLETVKLLRVTAPFAVAFLALTIFYKFDVLLLERLGDADSVGVYAAGYKLVDVVHALAVVAAAAVYPRLTRTTSEQARGSASRRTLELFLLLGVAGSGTLWLARAPLTLFLFGSAYAETATVLSFLAPALVALVLNILAIYLLSAADRVVPLALAFLSGCALKLVLAWSWIPRFGVEGMALAKLTTEIALTLGLIAVLSRAGAAVPRRRTVVLALLGIGLAITMALLPIAPPLAAGMYVSLVALLYGIGQALTPAEWRLLSSAVRAPKPGAAWSMGS